ncbi:MAG: carboxylesterase family protein, partial [Acidimicrobiales bacterium]
SDNVHMYLFTWPTPAFGGALGSCHALEIPFVFNTLDAQGASMFTGPVTDEVRELASTIHEAWTNFARTGVPAAEGLPEWPRYDPPRRATMVLGEHCSVEDDPAAAELAVWEGVA